jgi:hypothetical protein
MPMPKAEPQAIASRSPDSPVEEDRLEPTLTTTELLGSTVTANALLEPLN